MPPSQNTSLFLSQKGLGTRKKSRCSERRAATRICRHFNDNQATCQCIPLLQDVQLPITADLTAEAAGEQRLTERAKLVQNTDSSNGLALFSGWICAVRRRETCTTAKLLASTRRSVETLEHLLCEKIEMRSPDCKPPCTCL